MREEPPRLQRRVNDQAISLAREWRMLGRPRRPSRCSPRRRSSSLLYGTLRLAARRGRCSARSPASSIFRGGVDVIAHKLIPSPALYGAEDELKEQDVMSRRRALVLAPQVQGLVLARPDPADRARRHRAAVNDESAGRRARHDRSTRSRAALATARACGMTLVVAVPRQLPDPVRPARLPRHPADQGLRAGRRGLGRQARRRPRPGRGQAGDHPRRLALAVRRGVREGGRQARARRALPRRRPAPARRCSPRRSRPRSTARS